MCVTTVVKYAVKVHTGKKQGAGTDANVFLNIFGGQGDTGERFLTKSASNKNPFEKGNVRAVLLLLDICEFHTYNKMLTIFASKTIYSILCGSLV